MRAYAGKVVLAAGNQLAVNRIDIWACLIEVHIGTQSLVKCVYFPTKFQGDQVLLNKGSRFKSIA